MYPYIYAELKLYLSNYQFYLSIYFSIDLSIYLFIHPSIHLYTIHLSIYQSFHLSIYHQLSICPYISPNLSFYLCLNIFITIFNILINIQWKPRRAGYVSVGLLYYIHILGRTQEIHSPLQTYSVSNNFRLELIEVREVKGQQFFQLLRCFESRQV